MMRFNDRYERTEFLGFLDDFLPDDFVKKEEDIVISKPRHRKITKAQILGESKSLELTVLEMEHDSENDPRVTLATDAFKILADHWIHRALVIFKSKNSNNYRFSYLTISLDVNERSKIIRKYSNARRYSFYLGPGAKVNTPQQQLVKRGRLRDSEDLLSRFSLEVVNKEFFTQISILYTRLVGGERGGNKYDAELKINGHLPDELGNFAIRLIGRLVFCWFLKQKKSRAGVPLIADDLIGSGAVAEHSDYYHSVCAPLFFEILNRPAKRRPEGIQNKDLFEDVPYLNGGLFSAHKDDEYKFNTGSGTSERGVVSIGDAWFKAFFELLDVYNFTIDENTLVDTELSVDPEMLGRIFENLLAEVNPETGESARKATGSFYTPREVVDYMSDESLVAYLIQKTGIDEKKVRALCSPTLEDDEMYPLTAVEKKNIVEAVSAVTVLDPACGSGAFPIGILQKIVYILEQVDSDCSLYLERQLKGAGAELKRHIQASALEHNLNYVRKLGVIRESIFGIDIQPIAVDIARLRCFLTLVVDQQVDDEKPNKGIEPLPNLEFKFVCANTLISPPSNGQEGGLLGADPFETELLSLVDRYFAPRDELEKIELGRDLERLISDKTKREYDSVLNEKPIVSGVKNQEIFEKKHEKRRLEQLQAANLWDSYKNIFKNEKVDFFATEYFFPKVHISGGFSIVIGNPPYALIGKEDFLNTYGLKYPLLSGKPDLYRLFIERSLGLPHQSGIICFIVPNTLLTIPSAQKLREYITKEMRIRLLIDLVSPVFGAAAVNNIIFLFSKENTDAGNVLVGIAAGQEGVRNITGLQRIRQSDWLINKKCEWTIHVSETIRGFLRHLEENAFRLDEVFKEINLGMQVYHNTLHSDEQMEARFLHSDRQESEEWLPEYSGKHIERFVVNEEKNVPFVNYLDPNIYHKPEMHFFVGPRIIVREIVSERLAIAYAENKFAVNKSCFVLRSDKLGEIELKALMAVLYSKVIAFWIHHKGQKSKQKLFPRISTDTLKGLPIPKDWEKYKIDLSKYIDQIGVAKSDHVEAAQTLTLDLDILVYKLFGLSSDEINIVEASHV